jgi:RNA polymerase sigma-70 factor (ECF subfamily)
VSALEGKSRTFTGLGTPEYNLIQAAVSGNRSAFEVLIQKYKERLIGSLRYAIRPDVQVEDVVSDAFAIAYEKLHEFRGEASFYTWVYRIAMNESIGVYRRPGISISLDALAGSDESHLLAKIRPEEPLDKTASDNEIKNRAIEALGRIHQPYREILELFFLQDLSYEKIAKKLKIPEGTVMSRLHRARKLLQDSWRGKKTPALARQGV